jgi:hypothetical protein
VGQGLVTLLLHWCYTIVTLLLHGCYTIVTLLLSCCYTVVTLSSHCGYTVMMRTVFFKKGKAEEWAKVIQVF